MLSAERPEFACDAELLFRSHRLQRHSPAGPPVDLTCSVEVFLPIKPLPQHSVQSAGSAALCFITALLFCLMRALQLANKKHTDAQLPWSHGPGTHPEAPAASPRQWLQGRTRFLSILSLRLTSGSNCTSSHLLSLVVPGIS